MSTTLVKNGTVVTGSDRYDADIFIDKGVVTLIGQGLNLPADMVVDASGKLVMPGGIDVHTHLDMPFGGTTSADDFETGTIAAAFGGTTCLVDFAIQYRGQALRQGQKAPKYHALTRPPRAEGEATGRAIALAEMAGVPIYIVHLSSSDALQKVREARDMGLPAYAETCPQYLFLSYDNNEGRVFEGEK